MPYNNQKIDLEKYNNDYIMLLYNKIFNDENLVLNVKGDGNCQCWSVIQAVNKKKIKYTPDDYELMRSIRQKAYDLGYHDNGEGGCIKNDGVWFDGGIAFKYYKKLINDKDFSYTVIKPQEGLIGIENEELPMLPGVLYVSKKDSSLRGMFINLKNAGPAIIGLHSHYRSVNWENRDEFCRKLLKLIMCRGIYQYRKADAYIIKECFMNIIDDFFFTNDKNNTYDQNELAKNLDKIFDGVEDKKDKYIELIEFFYSEFERVYINENKTPKANEFLSMLLKNFKEKYIIFSDDKDKKINDVGTQDNGVSKNKEEENIKPEFQTQEKVNSGTQDVPRKIDPNEQEQKFNNKINELWDSKNLDAAKKYYKNLADTDKQKFIEAAEDKATKQAKEINEKLKTKNKSLELDFGQIKTYLKNCTNLFCDERNRKEILNQIEKIDSVRFLGLVAELVRRIFNFKSERSKFGFKRLKESRALRNFEFLKECVLKASNTSKNEDER